MRENQLRLCFEKVGRLKYISHLDLLRTMQSALTRAKVPFAYSQGFNPHPIMKFALPLSVGAESICELLDICTSESVDCAKTMEYINSVLPQGLYIREIYQPERKFTDIKYAEYTLALDYPVENERANEELQTLFKKPLFILKKTKSGEKNVDISPLIKKADSRIIDEKIKLKIICYAGNDNYLNPSYAVKALSNFLEQEPEDVRILRTRIFDEKLKEFR